MVLEKLGAGRWGVLENQGVCELSPTTTVSGRTTTLYRIGTGGLGNWKCGNSLTEETAGGIRIRNERKITFLVFHVAASKLLANIITVTCLYIYI